MQPGRWHFIVHDPNADNGLRDYVIADGAVASTNSVSQFASEVLPEDVLGVNSVRIDSSFIEQVASRYAAANRLSTSTGLSIRPSRYTHS